MSLNISAPILRSASDVIVRIDTDRLGARQMAAFRTGMRTGVIKGHSVPSILVARLRTAQAMPLLHFRRYNRLYGYGIPEGHPIYKEMTVAAASAKLLDQHHSSRRGYIDDVLRIATQQMSDFQLYIGSCPIDYAVARATCALAPAAMPESRYIDMHVWDGEERWYPL